MKRRPLIFALCASLLAYVGAYLFYRIVRHEAVLDYVGAHVFRPSWFPDGKGADFTFNSEAGQFGTIGESFASESVVSCLSETTGWDMAEPANTVFYPAARIDHLFTGRYIRFSRITARPIFSSAMTGHPANIEIADFDSWPGK